MTTYEKLLENAEKEDLTVKESVHFYSHASGLICGTTIGISAGLSNTAERTVILAEELGHHYTSTGNMLDLRNEQNRKMEYRARMYAYDLLIGLDGLIAGYENGCRTADEYAEFFDVTEKFFAAAMERYRSKYGCTVRHGEYCVSFCPVIKIESEKKE